MRLGYVFLLTLLLAACNPQAAPTPTPFIPTHTPQGPIVPTRVTPTPAPTEEPSITPSPTATDQPTATMTVTATVTNSPEPSATQSPLPTEEQISYGQEKTGLIDDTNPVYHYQFSADAGDSVTINHKASSGDLDPFLRLLDTNGRELASNDDARNATRDAALTAMTLPTAGVYTIIVTRFGEETGTSTGEFTLTLEKSTLDSPETLQTISYNEQITGSISTAVYETRYTFEAASGDVITIDLEAAGAGLDPFLILLNATGDELASNDDRSPRTRDSQIADFAVPAAGTYTIIATRYNGENGSTSGSYTLTITNQSSVSDDE